MARGYGSAPPGAALWPSRVLLAYIRNGRAAVRALGNASACHSGTCALGSRSSGAGGVRVVLYLLLLWALTTFT